MLTRFLAFTLLLISFNSYSQDLNQYEKHWYVEGADTLPYRILLPKDYNPKKKYPLVYFLHGAGERGNDNQKQLVHGAKLFLKDSVRNEYPTIVVFPQCPANSFWSNVSITFNDNKRAFTFKEAGEPTIAMKLAESLLMKLLDEYPVNKKKVYAGGLSMGGMGTFEIVRRHPNVFAAAFPICGGGSPATASSITKTRWWIFHGAKDDVVPPVNSEIMVTALEAARAKVKYTLYPNANHNSWDPAFAEPELLKWLFSQKR
ncbi:MAG TPA: prolyl oligopeptidase family serine peptidase [Chitinophagaceae bacterium]|jgi:predicted peptidase|nr:prolyl oligopeptidase family serine peptidase [Chitinophagaceae bacterium]